MDEILNLTESVSEGFPSYFRFPAGIYTCLLVRYILAPNVNRTDKSWNTSFIWLYSEKFLLRFGDESKFEGV